jgi:predicted permease
MISFAVIIVCVLSGYAISLLGLMPKGGHKGINAWILYLALPAVTLKYIPLIQWKTQLILPVVSPVLVWLGAWLMARLAALWWQMPGNIKGALTLTGGLSNTSFLGFIAVYYSEKDISIAIICDQAAFILLSTVGVITAVRYGQKGQTNSWFFIKRLLCFPTFIACVAAFVLPHFINLSAADLLFDKIGSTTGPLALFSIGLQLDFKKWRSGFKYLSVGVLYKLMIAPALVSIMALLFKQRGIIAEISIFEAAMPTLASAGVMADEYNVEPELANMVVGITTILSFITMCLWWYVLRGL